MDSRRNLYATRSFYCSPIVHHTWRVAAALLENQEKGFKRVKLRLGDPTHQGKEAEVILCGSLLRLGT